MLRPLFSELIPVSEAEVQAWLDTVPNLSATPSRREAYRKAYNVESKIRAAKNKVLTSPLVPNAIKKIRP